MVSLFSLEKPLKLPLVRIFLDFGQVLKFFNKEKGQVGTLYKFCPLHTWSNIAYMSGPGENE